ncbi:MAG TPA: sulfite exporter TauE/SafE family protein [Sphingomicrobium sp.]|nr:sulfite exporter TauE/SafE family protein [Sphingomicrobium sp.]
MFVALFTGLILAALAFSFVLIRAAIAERAVPTVESMVLGAVVSFFDTLGIGSFAPTTAWLKFRKLVPDRLIPPTMLVGLTWSVFAESIIFLKLITVDPVLLIGCAIAVLVGGLVGAPLVAHSRTWVVQLVVGIALVIAAIAYTMMNRNWMPAGGAALSLPLALTIVAIIANFIIGILLNFGVGNYAPTLVILSLMGMNPRAIFPIMAAGAAVMGAGACIRHIQMGKMDLKVVLGLGIGGVPGVLAAAFIVWKIPIDLLRWLIVVVVLYTAVVMFRAAMVGRGAGPLTAEEAVAAS